MKVLIINVVYDTGSTGRICANLAHDFIANGDECYIAYGRGEASEEIRNYSVKIGNKLDLYSHLLYTRLFDKHGFGSKRATKRFLKWVEQYKPDLIWLHNLHGYYINIELLFRWLSSHRDVKVRWTLHDCWPFTGHCCHFSYAACNEWKNGCKYCIQKSSYPKTVLFSNSANNYNKKKNLFTSLGNLKIIVPSKWLASLVNESYLGKYPVEVVYNKIDSNVFKPTKSNYKSLYGVEDKKILLGVANDWNEKKGLNDFIELAHQIDDRFVIFLIGIKERQLKSILSQFNNKSIHKLGRFEKPICLYSSEETESTKLSPEYLKTIAIDNYKGAAVMLFPHLRSAVELAKFYTMADLFINATYEDTYPTVNLEAQSCGTEVITYKTGGSVESVPAVNHVDVGNITGLIQKIKNKCSMDNE